MAAKYLYVCPDCLEFFSMNGWATPKCEDCGGKLKETDIAYKQYSILTPEHKQRIKDEYAKRHGLKKKEKPKQIYPPEVSGGFSIGFLKVIAYITLIGSMIGGGMTLNFVLIIAGLIGFSTMNVMAETAMDAKRIRAMVEDRFYGKNRL